MAMTTPNDDGKGGESLVDRDSHFDGLYKTKHNLRVEGEAEGDIQCQGTLTVEQGARVKAKVAASNVTVAGELAPDLVDEGAGILHGGRIGHGGDEAAAVDFFLDAVGLGGDGVTLGSGHAMLSLGISRVRAPPLRPPGPTSRRPAGEPAIRRCSRN